MPHSRILINSLKIFFNGLTKKECFNKNIDVNLLIKHGLIGVKKIKNLELEIPEEAPRWASKYKFTKKKYGITEKVNVVEKYYLTNKGQKLKIKIGR